MPNENLQNALEQAGLTLEAFAEVIQVDPKSVQRWVTGNTIPYPRHRQAVCRALNVEEHELWPEQAPTVAAEDSETEEPGGGAPHSDVVGTWGHADDETAPDAVAFINVTDGPIDIFDPFTGLELPDGLVDAIAAQATVGRPVRILTDAPSENLWALEGAEQVQLLTDEIELWSCWFIQAGERMLLTLNLNDHQKVYPPPVIELAATASGGLFDRLQDKFEELWELAQEHHAYDQPPAEPPSGDGNQDGNAQAANPLTAGSPPASQPGQSAAAGQDHQAAQAARRRWPGRPT